MAPYYIPHQAPQDFSSESIVPASTASGDLYPRDDPALSNTDGLDLTPQAVDQTPTHNTTTPSRSEHFGPFDRAALWASGACLVGLIIVLILRILSMKTCTRRWCILRQLFERKPHSPERQGHSNITNAQRRALPANIELANLSTTRLVATLLPVYTPPDSDSGDLVDIPLEELAVAPAPGPLDTPRRARR